MRAKTSAARIAPRSSTSSAGSASRDADARADSRATGSWPGPRRRRDVEHGAAGHGLSPAGLPEHEPVADVQHQRRGRRDAGERFPAGLELRRSVEADTRVDLGRADVQLERAARRDGARASADRRGGAPRTRGSGATPRAGASTSPRPSRSRSTPTRFAATRDTGHARSSLCLCVCRERIRARAPAGSSSTSSPTPRQSPVSVPVTTVPAPLIVNTRSMCRRARASVGRSGAVEHRVERRRQRVDAFAGLRGHRRRSARRRGRCRRRVRGSPPSPASSVSSSTRSRFVSAITPPRTPSTSRICRCSSDCGFHPSSAATTNSTSRTGPTPASMLPMKRSCPGTSTKPISRPDGSVHHA